MKTDAEKNQEYSKKLDKAFAAKGRPLTKKEKEVLDMFARYMSHTEFKYTVDKVVSL